MGGGGRLKLLLLEACFASLGATKEPAPAPALAAGVIRGVVGRLLRKFDDGDCDSSGGGGASRGAEGLNLNF